MISKILNKAESLKLFEDEAILLGQDDVIPFYKAVDLFGEEAAIFFDRNTSQGGYLKGGIDYNGMGENSDERPMINYLYKPGFLKLITEHNYLLVIKDHKEGEKERYT